MNTLDILIAKDVMIENPETLDAELPVEEAYKKIIATGFRFMPVIRNGIPVGIAEQMELMSYIERKNRKELEAKDMMLSYLMHHENYGCL